MIHISVGIRERNLIKKIEAISLKYHKLSLLFNELAGSLTQKANHGQRYKELMKDIKDIDFDKIKSATLIHLFREEQK